MNKRGEADRTSWQTIVLIGLFLLGAIAIVYIVNLIIKLLIK